MKKLIIFAVMALAVASVSAQKKVAVWETKCSDGTVTQFQSTMVRGAMETAAANAQGFTGYDRASFDAIIKEQEFQRSGAVSNSDIKRLGEMAGVQYIIVPEATVNGKEMYIVVKMLDVETGEFGSAYDVLCTTASTDIKRACAKLGSRLFGGIGESSDSAGGGASPTNDINSDREKVTSKLGNAGLAKNEPYNQDEWLETTALEEQIVRWEVNSRPAGADLYWRVVSTTPDVKSTNKKYLTTTPYEATKSLDIKGLTYQNSGNVRIILTCDKEGYSPQEKEYNVRMIIDQEEISAFFKLVGDN